MNYNILHTVLSELVIDENVYSRDCGMAYLRQLVSKYKSLSGEDSISPAEREEMLDVLDSIYTSQILSSSRWTDGRLFYNDGDSFSCIIAGENVAGTVSVHPKHLGIHIEIPFNADSYCGLLELAPEIYTQYPFVGSHTNEEGTERIRNMIVRRYYASRNSR